MLGLERLRAIHLNDSMTPFSSFKDRHETIGKGSLGEQAFINIINHPVLRELPFFLETPRDDAGHGEEITWLKEHLPQLNRHQGAPLLIESRSFSGEKACIRFGYRIHKPHKLV